MLTDAQTPFLGTPLVPLQARVLLHAHARVVARLLLRVLHARDEGLGQIVPDRRSLLFVYMFVAMLLLSLFGCVF